MKSGKPDRMAVMAVIHICNESCPETLTGEDFTHGLQRLREVQRELGEGRPGEEKVSPSRKKKKKEEKKRTEDAEKKKKRRSSSASGSSDSSIGKCSLAEMYGGTGLDPNLKKRRKILRKARKTARGKEERKREQGLPNFVRRVQAVCRGEIRVPQDCLTQRPVWSRCGTGAQGLWQPLWWRKPRAGC